MTIKKVLKKFKRYFRHSSITIGRGRTTSNTYEEYYLDKNRRFFRSSGVTINIKLLTRNTFTRNPI